MKKLILAGIILAGAAALVAGFLLFQQKRKVNIFSNIEEGQTVTYNLNFGHDMPVESPQHAAAQRFAEIVNYKSKGQVTVEVFPNQQLGTDHQMIEAARAGKLAVILPPTAKLSTLAPALQYADLPFLFPAREDAYAMLDGEPGRMLLEQLEPHGLIGITFWESGFKQFTANRAIRSPNDFQGLNIRVMKSRIIMDQFKSFGANPIPIDFHETYQALKDGVVDGEENPLVSIVNMKFYEVQSHVIISNHAYLGCVFTFSKEIFESLPAEIQGILVSTAKELTSLQRKMAIEKEEVLIRTIEASGTHVYYLSKEERGRFRAATEHIVEKYRQIIGADILDKTLDLLQRKYGIPEENEIIIGLDADMTSGSAPSGLSTKRGMEIAIQEINQQGGILGKKLSLKVRDHAGISARGIANMKYFSTVKNLVAVMGGLHSPVALSELNIIHSKKIIYLDPWAAATAIVDNNYRPNYVFRVSVRDEYAGTFLVEQALKEYQSVALLLENTGWGRSNHQAIVAALAENKLIPAVVEWFNWGEEDMSPYFARVENSGAEVLLLVATAPEGSQVIKSMVKRQNQIPIISHWGITGGYFWEEVGRELDLVNLRFLQTFSFLTHNNSREKDRFLSYLRGENYEKLEKIKAPVGMAHAYDLVHLLAKAIKMTGSLDRSIIRDNLERIEFYQGLVKTYSPPFTPERHDALDRNDFIMAKYDSHGSIVPIEEDSP